MSIPLITMACYAIYYIIFLLLQFSHYICSIYRIISQTILKTSGHTLSMRDILFIDNHIQIKCNDIPNLRKTHV